MEYVETGQREKVPIGTRRPFPPVPNVDELLGGWRDELGLRFTIRDAEYSETESRFLFRISENVRLETTLNLDVLSQNIPIGTNPHLVHAANIGQGRDHIDVRAIGVMRVVDGHLYILEGTTHDYHLLSFRSATGYSNQTLARYGYYILTIGSY